MSLIVVMNGPDATAGSIFILSMKIGMTEPDKVATVNVAKMEIPTKIPKNNCPFQIKIMMTINNPHTDPVINPVVASRNNRRNFPCFP